MTLAEELIKRVKELKFSDEVIRNFEQSSKELRKNFRLRTYDNDG